MLEFAKFDHEWVSQLGMLEEHVLHKLREEHVHPKNIYIFFQFKLKWRN